MATVQFRSAKETIAAFDSLDCEAWSLWDGKRLMFKGIGNAELEGFLDLMNENGASNAIYTLAYYEELTDKKKINNKTPFDGSFNFRLNSDGLEVNQGQYKQIFSENALQSKVGALEHKLDALLERFDKEDTIEENKLGVIGEILGHPSIAPMIPTLMQAVVGRLLGATQPDPPRLAKVAGLPAYESAADIRKDTKLQQAVERLLKADPDLAEHLTKLADLAERDVNSFAYILSSLDKL